MNRAWSPEVVEIGEAIWNLSLKDAKQLSDYIKEVHGIEAVGDGIRFVPPPPPEEKAPEKTDFAVKYSGEYDAAKKIGLIKVVREITGLGLKEAKELVEGGPKIIREGLEKPAAEEMKKKLEEGGGKITLE